MSNQMNRMTTENATTVSPVSPESGGRMVVRQAATGIILTLVLTLVSGLLYPLVTGGFAQVLFPTQANGSLVVDRNGAPIGSELIGQQFTQAKYFHPRPSAAGDKGYDATSSSASNLGPTNASLVKAVQDRATAYRQENLLSPNEALPPDAVTSSGSGLDPEISPANAVLQSHRIALARSLSDAPVRALVEQNIEGRDLGIFGEPRVNVLKLNLALDRAAP
jgi:potassium-transporting ATPase KdpC subunit